MKHKLILFSLFLFLGFGISHAQNCRIVTSSNKVCLGNTLLFTVAFDAGFTATSYSWNFGNGNTSTQASPVYQYPARGLFTPSVTVNFAGGGSCTVNGTPVSVVANPIANFNITTALTQCFKNNNSCITDISAPGADNAPIQTRLFLWGDGSFSNETPPASPTLCKSYTLSPLGGVFTLTMEIYDTNNCVARKEIKDAITIYAKMQEVSFKTTYTAQCNVTPSLFTNTSKIPQAQVKSYQWDFGNGNTATSPWSNFTHNYTQTGIFQAKLIVEDLNGCRDTATVFPAAENYKLDSTIYLNTIATCFNKNKIVFESKNNYPSALINWAFYRVGNPVRVDSVNFKPLDSISFAECGRYRITMYVRLGACSIRKDTFVDIWGPKAVIETQEQRIGNSSQCEIHDTVVFRGPPVDKSCYYPGGNIFRLWDFDDPFAPACTTDVKANINVGINCRYSKDSAVVRHVYKPGEERCYYPKLFLTNTLTGCTHYDSTNLKLTQPDAGWDSTSVPIRPGLTYKGIVCLNSTITFDLSKTLPICGREMAWIMPDTACSNATWLPVDTFSNTFVWSYARACNKNGKVTVGLIIKNGSDKNGKPCFDTAYYPVMFTFFPLDPTFTVTRLDTGCGPYRIRVNLNDSIQDSIVRMVFTGSVNRTIMLSPGDSILPSQLFNFPTPGIKRIRLSLYNTRGCILDYQLDIYFGFFKSFQPEKEIVCLSDSLALKENVSYYNSIYPFWKDPTRAAAGKERLLWDFGDGKGFITTGPAPKYKYNRIGNYRIRMVAFDSTGCRDTFVYAVTIKVVDLQAAIKAMQPRYLCAPQILVFKDQSFYSDSSALYGVPPYDQINGWLWDFGDNKTPSLLQDPVHAYTTNGTFPVVLKVTTAAGCKDSATIPIWIDGPRPRFNILRDTFGCAPFKVELKNTTGYPLINWVWYFRDQNNATASSKLDTNVSHTYTLPGVYKISVVGEDTIFDPLTGNYKTCVAVFPDSLNPNAETRSIRVLPTISAQIIGPDSVCVNQAFELTARPKGLYQAFNWQMTDTSAFVQKLFPDTIFNYTYDKSGKYRVTLYPILSGSICTDTARKEITVSEVEADFDMDQNQLPFVTFTNKSKNAVRYEWNFGHPSSGSRNFSTLENPTHNFVGDSGSFTVCLMAYNELDCMDSICKTTFPAEVRIVIPNVFTPNGDDFNDAYDIDAVGIVKYNLAIFDRWGDRVYESERDGIGNDGVNWNGKVRNTGRECPDGTYFFAFTYQLINMTSPKDVHGTITLLRNN